MRRKALVVGAGEYGAFTRLNYAEKDARAIANRLKYHADQNSEPNFDVRLMLSGTEPVTRAALRAAIHDLFVASDDLDVAFYFTGHGLVSDAGGYLVTTDGVQNDYGVSMEELTSEAHRSRASSVLIMLDCCHAGGVGDLPVQGGAARALLRENMTILAASLPMQEAVETAEGGLFTAALKDALDGASADVLGEVTVASVYSLIERRFSLWQQRPVAKSHLTRPILLRKVTGALSRHELRRIVDLFPHAADEFRMDPDHDPERDVDGEARTAEVPEKIEIGRLFKRLRDAALLSATSAGEDLYYVAQRSHTVRLTLFGREYWRLVKQGRV